MTQNTDNNGKEEKRLYPCDWLCGKDADRIVIITDSSFLYKDVDVRLCNDCQQMLQKYSGIQYQYKEI